MNGKLHTIKRRHCRHHVCIGVGKCFLFRRACHDKIAAGHPPAFGCNSGWKRQCNQGLPVRYVSPQKNTWGKKNDSYPRKLVADPTLTLTLSGRTQTKYQKRSVLARCIIAEDNGHGQNEPRTLKTAPLIFTPHRSQSVLQQYSTVRVPRGRFAFPYTARRAVQYCRVSEGQHSSTAHEGVGSIRIASTVP